MNMNYSDGEEAPVDLPASVQGFFQEAAEDLVRVINQIKAGAFQDAKQASLAIRDLKAAFQLAMEERNKVEKYSRQSAGQSGRGPLDLDAARDEIGRRLACLRDARGS